MAGAWRRVRRHFGISAPRMAVRTHLPWWSRGTLLATLLVIIAGMWWWGFDFGQILGGFNRKELEARLVTLEAETAKAKAEAADLRMRNTGLESDLAMTRGVQEALTRQATELSGENAQLKDELAFLQTLVSETSTTAGLQFQRLVVVRDGEDTWRYSMLIVRGGNPADDFTGSLTLLATLGSTNGDRAPRVLALPEDDPGTSAALKLKFKYYQRVEGRIHVPPGTRITALTVRAFQAGQGTPQAVRTLTVS
jgi:hypothetical protein